MLKWSAFPFIRISISLIPGIISFEYFPVLWDGYFLVLIFFTVFYLVSWVYLRRQIIHAILSFLFFSYLGGLLTLLNDQSSYHAHYINYPAVDGMIGTIVSDATERDRYYRYNFSLHKVKEDTFFRSAIGRIYLYIEKDTSPLEYGDVLAVSRGYFSLSPPKNPYEFDYKEYLRKQHIFAHAFVSSKEVFLIKNDPPNLLLSWAYAIRSSIQQKINNYIIKDRERAIFSALLLGIKDQLDHDIKTSYASAGAMHVLAVSGLHVGIIYYIILLLLRPVKEKQWGVIPFMLISLSVIWMYALVTGFSPSVMRAATMFSVIIISEAFNKRANIYNSLGVAAFLLIIIDPYIIYSVGFQLSFAAVFGIVFIYPRLYRMLDVPTRAGNYLWSITCVSVAAQLATFPLSLYYFHQFPTYFLISNLLVIPAAMSVLCGGILMLLVGSIFQNMGQVIGWLLQWLVCGLNEGISSLQMLPYPLFDWLYYDLCQVLLVYGILVFIIRGLGKYSFSSLVLATFLIACFSGWDVWKGLKRNEQQKVIFYEIDKRLAIDFIDGANVMLLVDQKDPGLTETLDFQVNPNRLASGLDKAQKTVRRMDSVEFVYSNPGYDLIVWKEHRIFVVKDARNLDFVKSPESDIVYLRDFPKDQPLSDVKGKKLLLGTDFNYYEAEAILNKAEREGIGIHSLSRDGYWELDLKNTIW